MTSEHMNISVFEVEKKQDRVARYVGRLGDLGLGSHDGIPSEYANMSDAELHEVAEQLLEKLIEPTDLTALSCIDGRKRIDNADGSSPEARYHRAGGTSANVSVAHNAEASIVDTLSPDDSLDTQVKIIDGHIAQTTGFEPSAHQGGCGKANGEVDDNEAIHTKPEVLSATKSVLDIPEVRADLIKGYENEISEGESLYDKLLAERVRENAGKTARLLTAGGWNGQKYVEKVEKNNPRGVENLKVDHNDKFHGHKEPYVALIVGRKTLQDEGFVINLEVVKEIANALSGQRGLEGYRQALIAELAEEMAVSGRLPSKDTPVFLLGA